jgi:hypothetical protein
MCAIMMTERKAMAGLKASAETKKIEFSRFCQKLLYNIQLFK